MIFIGIFLLGISTEPKIFVKRLIGGIKSSAKHIEDTAANTRESFIGKVFNYTEIMIQKSNIRMYMAYSIWSHFLICAVFCILAFRWVSQYLSFVVSLIFTVVILIVPYMILDIIGNLTSSREKKNAVNFLIIFKNFFLAGMGDIFDAFERMIPFISEPLKSYVEVMVYEKKHKINAVTCLQNFKEKLGTHELKIFTENLSICYFQGGDTIGLTDTFIEEISKLDEDDDKQNTEDIMLSYGLYILLGFNYLLISILFRSSYKNEIFGSLWGQIVFIIDTFVCAYIMYMTLKKN